MAAQHTHIFGPSPVNEFRVSWVQRDLQFPENDPNSPTATITGLFTIGGLSNFPQGRVRTPSSSPTRVTWTKGRHTFKFGADIRYNKAGQPGGLRLQGHLHLQQPGELHEQHRHHLAQALQTSSWKAKQWQTYFFAQDDFRVNPDLTLNLGLRYELSDVPLGFFGATDPESLAALVPAPVREGHEQLGARVGFAWRPRSSNGLFGDGKTVFRGGFGMGYDVLFYNLLTVNASNYPRVVMATLNNVVDVYPNMIQAGGAAVFNPLAGYMNSPEDPQNPDSSSGASRRREVGQFVFELGYTGSRGRHGINQVQVNPAVLTAEQAALVAATEERQRHPQRPGAARLPAVRHAHPDPRRRGPGRQRRRGEVEVPRL